MRTVKAIHSIKRACQSGLSDVVGYDDDGQAIVRLRCEYVEPGTVFQLDDSLAERLLATGAVTEDLDYPMASDARDV